MSAISAGEREIPRWSRFSMPIPVLRGDRPADVAERHVDVVVGLIVEVVAGRAARMHEQMQVPVADVAHHVAPAVRPATAQAALDLLDVPLHRAQREADVVQEQRPPLEQRLELLADRPQAPTLGLGVGDDGIRDQILLDRPLHRGEEAGAVGLRVAALRLDERVERVIAAHRRTVPAWLGDGRGRSHPT